LSWIGDFNGPLAAGAAAIALPGIGDPFNPNHAGLGHIKGACTGWRGLTNNEAERHPASVNATMVNGAVLHFPPAAKIALFCICARKRRKKRTRKSPLIIIAARVLTGKSAAPSGRRGRRSRYYHAISMV
jgi:hypothetical protein